MIENFANWMELSWVEISFFINRTKTRQFKSNKSPEKAHSDGSFIWVLYKKWIWCQMTEDRWNCVGSVNYRLIKCRYWLPNIIEHLMCNGIIFSEISNNSRNNRNIRFCVSITWKGRTLKQKCLNYVTANNSEPFQVRIYRQKAKMMTFSSSHTEQRERKSLLAVSTPILL